MNRWLRACTHPHTETEEVGYTEDTGKVSWSRAVFCTRCGAVVTVLAQFYGYPSEIEQAAAVRLGSFAREERSG